jgi:hypothetical protein
MDLMKDDIPAFEAAIARLMSAFDALPESLTGIKPRPEDWSIKEIACHLVDSASNNHQRFTRLQRMQRLEFPAYETEPWVAVEKPEGLPWKDLLGLLKLYNVFILHLVRNMDPACLGNVWAIGGESKTLDFLVRDYYRHIDWHLAHLANRVHEVRALSQTQAEE